VPELYEGIVSISFKNVAWKTYQGMLDISKSSPNTISNHIPAFTDYEPHDQ
jgi:hypothetical protein